MRQYRLPAPGELDPIANLQHYTGNYLSVLRGQIKSGEGGQARLEVAREVVSGVLSGFADGTYTYEHSQAFNPDVARKLSEEVLSTLREGASVDDIRSLEEKLQGAADEHAIQTGQPERTRAALDDLRDRLKAERESQR